MIIYFICIISIGYKFPCTVNFRNLFYCQSLLSAIIIDSIRVIILKSIKFKRYNIKSLQFISLIISISQINFLFHYNKDPILLITFSQKISLMAMVESTLSSALKKHQTNPYNAQSKPQYTFYIQLPNSQTIYKTQLELEPITLVEDALILAIEEFNNQLSAEGVILVKKIDYYIPRLPKRNGKAKTDMPCLDIQQKLIDIKITSIAIQIKDPQNAIHIKKVSIQDLPSKRSQTKSTIMIQMSQKSSKKYSEQIKDQQQLVRSQQKSDCFCSFC